MTGKHHHFLVIGGSDTKAAELCAVFVNGTFEATHASRFGQAIAFARTKRPSALVLVGNVNESATQEWIAALTLQPGTASFPLVVVTPKASDAAALAALQGGAAGLLDEELELRTLAHAVVETVGLGPSDPRSAIAASHSGATVLRRVVGYFGHHQGTLTVRIEGAKAPAGVRFQKGQIADAAFGSRTGQAAVGELMINGDAARWRFILHGAPVPAKGSAPSATAAAARPEPAVEPVSAVVDNEEEIVLFDEGDADELDAVFGSPTEDDIDFIDISMDDFQPPSVPAPPPPMPDEARVAQLPPMRVLVVDDDTALLGMYQKVLAGRHHTVFIAENGREGFAVATRERPDIILSDIMMPEIDGWGLLGLVRRDYRVRETVFALLSCHSDYLTSLKAFDAGADEYLEKGMRPTEVVTRVESLVSPRRNLIAVIRPGFAFSDDLRTVGAANLLRALSDARVTGTLTVRPRDVVIEVHFHEGTIRHARAQLGATSATKTDTDALAHLLRHDSAPVSFAPGPVNAEPTLQQTFGELCEALVMRLNDEREDHEENLLAQDRPLRATAPDVAKFFALTCPDPMRPVLAALYGGRSPRAVMATSDASPLVVEALVKDVLRKGVMHFAESA